jgi:hypothetical protein
MPEAVDQLEQARAIWERLHRELEAARCDALLGRVLLDHQRESGVEALNRAAALFERVGIEHRAVAARELAGSQTGLAG